jgi:hypothetical protein
VEGAANGDDAGIFAPFHARQEEAGEGEVTEMVRAKLELEPIGGEWLLRDGDAAGVVDEHVEAVVLSCEPIGEAADGVEAAEVKGADLKLGVRDRCHDPVRGLGALLGVAHGERYARAGACQLARGDEADAAVRTGDDGDAAVLVGDVGGCPPSGHRADDNEPAPSRQWVGDVIRECFC